MQHDTPAKLSALTVFLHWLVGLTIIGLLAVGVIMTEFQLFALYPWHKSIGVLIAVVILGRVIWRWRNGWPVPVGQPKPMERFLARSVHWLLIIGTVLMPISGFAMSALGGHGVAVFGFELVAVNPDPADPAKRVAHNAALAGLSKEVHYYTGYLLIVALALHIAAAYKHHLLDKDGTLRRMLGQRV